MNNSIFTHSRSLKSPTRFLFGGAHFYIGRVSLMFMLMAFIAIMGFIYLYSFNANATVGYELSRLEYERDKLMTVKEQNNIELSKSQSLDFIKQSPAVAGMVKANKVEYVGSEGTLAVNY